VKRLAFYVMIGLIVGMIGSVGAFAAKDTVIVAVGAPPRTMNPHGSDADCNLGVMANIFEGLMQREGASGELVPALATSWDRVDLNTWRFTLRQGVKFHNGNDFTWEDVAFSFERLKDPEVSEFLFTGGIVESVEPVDGDPWTIDIKTTTPVAYFLQNTHQLWIMDKESTEARSVGEVGVRPIGTGPYKFVEWVKGSYLKLEANEDYWGGAPPIKYAEFRPIVEPATRLAAIETGEVDVMQDVPVELFDRAEANPDLELVTRPARRVIFLGLRNEPGFPGTDVRVRKAIYMAINEQEIINTIMFGHATLAAQMVDPATLGYNPALERLPYDPEKASRLLAEAGYADGFDITLTGPNDRYVQDEQICEAVAKYLAKVNINVTVDTKPKAIFFPEVTGHELDFYLVGWFDGAYSLPRTFFKMVHTIDPDTGYGGWNGPEFSDPLLDKLLDESAKIVDPKLYKEWAQLMNKVAMEDKVAYIPLHHQEDAYAVYKPSGVKFTARPDTWIVFKEITFE
jgi:peptide/nickel transport system substrate-binding protein